MAAAHRLILQWVLELQKEYAASVLWDVALVLLPSSCRFYFYQLGIAPLPSPM